MSKQLFPFAVSQSSPRVVALALAIVLTGCVGALAGGADAGPHADAIAAEDARVVIGEDARVVSREDAGMVSGEDAGVVIGEDARPPSEDASISNDAHTELEDAFIAVSDAGSDAAIPTDEDPPGTWRSELFPRDWLPIDRGGSPDPDGRFLPDFSTAGWHRGDARPPVGGAATVTVDAGMWGDGVRDATGAIQSAIDATCARSGGGVVLLPAGTYRVRVQVVDGRVANEVLRIACSRLVLRGEGPTRTRILIDEPERMPDGTVNTMANRIGISIRGSGIVWDSATTATRRLAQDELLPTRTLTLASGSLSLMRNDWIVVRNENTSAFRTEHHMTETGFWPTTHFRGISYPRRVLDVGTDAMGRTTVTLDGPTHAPLRTRDVARVYRITPIFEVGLESFAIGMVENGRDDSLGDGDWDRPGTTGYEVNASRAIELDRVRDAWIHDVDSFRPAGNDSGAHLLSNGISLEEGAFRVTIEECDLARPQYRGNNGNGYLFQLQGHDALVVDSSSRAARHGFIINNAASGNVFLRVHAIDTRLSEDSHRYLANANLYDGTILDGAWLQAVNRGITSGGAGHTATMHVFWNTVQVRRYVVTWWDPGACAVESSQWGHGYLIGSTPSTARLCPSTVSDPTGAWATFDPGTPPDFVEGEGIGDTLWPTSLHAAQLALRCERESRECVTW